MSTTMKANAELEPRPLEAHELDIVSGSGIPVQQYLLRYGLRPEGGSAYGSRWGMCGHDLAAAWYDAPVTSPVKLWFEGNVGRTG